MVIEPLYGLCNRLRVVFSWHKYAKARGESLVVVWKPTNSCNGYFLDCFQPVENITFVDEWRDQEPVKTFTPLDTCFSFEDLKLTPRLYLQLKNRLQLLTSDFVAAHIRRTDFTKSMQKKGIEERTDQEFLTFFNKNTPRPCFLATDNRKTQAFFEEQLGSRLIICDKIK